MNSTEITIIITIAGFFMSVGTSAFIAGLRAGRMVRDIEYIRRDLGLLMSLFKLVPINSDSHTGKS